MTLKRKLKNYKMNRKATNTKKTDMVTVKRSRLIGMAECAVFAAVLCILSPIAVFIGPVPVTLQMFGVLLAAVVLGAKKGVIAVTVYILLGFFGLPVFSGGKAGAGVLLGPTGGYIVACIPAAFIMGLLCSNKLINREIKLATGIVAGLISVFVCYVCGTVWYANVLNVDFKQAISVCVLPFVPVDMVKIVFAVVFGRAIKRNLLKSINY